MNLTSERVEHHVAHLVETKHQLTPLTSTNPVPHPLQLFDNATLTIRTAITTVSMCYDGPVSSSFCLFSC